MMEEEIQEGCGAFWHIPQPTVCVQPLLFVLLQSFLSTTPQSENQRYWNCCKEGQRSAQPPAVRDGADVRITSY